MPSPREEQAAALKRDYEMTFTTEHGQRVLRHIDSMCFARRSTFPKWAVEMSTDPLDPIKLAAAEGRRQVSLMIHEQLELSLPELVGRPKTAKLEAP